MEPATLDKLSRGVLSTDTKIAYVCTFETPAGLPNSHARAFRFVGVLYHRFGRVLGRPKTGQLQQTRLCYTRCDVPGSLAALQPSCHFGQVRINARRFPCWHGPDRSLRAPPVSCRPAAGDGRACVARLCGLIDFSSLARAAARCTIRQAAARSTCRTPAPSAMPAV